MNKLLDAATENPLLALLVEHQACKPAVEWVKEQGFTDLQTAWDACERADWMLWLVARIEGPDDPPSRRLRLAACACAEDALPLFEKRFPNDARPRRVIEVARRFANGEATDDERNEAAAAAAAAAAAWAAGAARAAAAAWAAGAAEAAGAAAAAWAAWAAEAAAHKRMAAKVREIIPNPEVGK